jgi:hypothetical protein
MDTFLHLEPEAIGDRSLQFSIPVDAFSGKRYLIITAEYAAVTTGGRGMAVAMNPAVNANFAFCSHRYRRGDQCGWRPVRPLTGHSLPINTAGGSRVGHTK